MTKTTAMTELTTPAAADIIKIVDDPGGTPLSKKITLTNLFSLLQAGSSPSITLSSGVASISEDRLLMVKTEVSAAEMLDLLANPKQVAPAPGTDKLIIPVQLALVKDGTDGFVIGTTDLDLVYKAAAGTKCMDVSCAAGCLDQTTDAFGTCLATDETIASLNTDETNEEVFLYAGTADLTSAGSGDPVTVWFWYRVVTCGLV